MFSLEFKIPEKILILEVHRTVGLDTKGQLTFWYSSNKIRKKERHKMTQNLNIQ